MPTNNINVVLTTTAPQTLDVKDNGGQNLVNAASQPTTITWNLTGNLAQGSFVPMNDPSGKYGFEWVTQPPPAWAGTPTIGASGNSLSVVDTHLDATSNGEATYRLRARLNGTVYSTTATVSRTATVNNPVIINR
jgi:hypothetical protein